MEVSIEKRGNTLGRIHAEGLDPGEGPDEAKNEIVVLYAGAAGELAQDASRASVVRLGASSDDQQAEAIMSGWLLAKTKKQRHDLETLLRQRAESVVKKNWAEIDALATELLQLGSLDSNEAILIVDGAGGDQDAQQALLSLRALKAASRLSPSARKVSQGKSHRRKPTHRKAATRRSPGPPASRRRR